MKCLQLYIPISSFQNICRVCLLQCDELTAIDEIRLAYSYRNGLEEELSASDVFRKYCNVQIESDDSKPNNLCQICINMMCQAYNVFEQFVESNNILDKLIKQHKLEEKAKHIGSCTEELPQPSLKGCKLSTTKPALENEHSQDKATIVLLDPEVLSKNGVESIHDEDTTSRDDIFYETNCEEKPKRTMLSDNYRITEEFIMLVPDHQKVNPEMCDVFDSNEIESVLNQNYKGTISSDEEYSLGSADCGSQDLPFETSAVWDHTYSNRETLVEVKEVDSALNTGFERAAALRTHVLKMHKEGDTKKPLQLYTCEFCQKTFSRRAACFRHRISHPECKNIKCLFCDKICTNAEEYREHKRKDHSTFVCDICSKGFPNQIHLTNHKYLHNVDYRCTYCDASFKTRQTHQIHEYGHTGEKPFQCEYCDKQFKQQAHMKQHIECKHTEKRFKCELCNKAFVFRNTYRNHMRMHTGKKPFVCPYCAKTFRATSVRHKHVRRDHPERMEDFLLFKKNHQEKEVKLADSQTGDLNDSEYNMEETLSAGEEDDDYIMD